MSDAGQLLVPMVVEAMVLTDVAASLVRDSMNYTQIGALADPSPAPFANPAGHPKGVFVKWTLPAALRHGVQQADGSLEFPKVPNRFCVVRLYRPLPHAGSPVAAAPPQASAWVIESDILGEASGASYIDPRQSRCTPTTIGRKTILSASSPWTELGGGDPYFLTAVSESNPAFAAYQPFNQNVFSMFDDGLTNDNLTLGVLSYFVLGWYSVRSADILGTWGPGPNDESFADLLDRLRWSLTETGDLTAASSLYHGATYGVPWQPDNVPPASPRDKADPHVAIANNSLDGVGGFARSAFAAATPPALDPDRAVELIQAFQYDLLPMLSPEVPGAAAMVEQKIRGRWFGSATGGTRWTIAAAETVPGKTPPPPPDADVLAADNRWLASLNSAQATLDEAERDLADSRRRLYELWWKEQANDLFVGEGDDPPWAQEAFTDPIKNARSAVQTSQAAQAAASGAVATALAALPAGVAAGPAVAQPGFPPQRVLKGVSEPRFWSPVDPVVVLSKTAHMLSIEPDNQLGCRWPGEVMSAIGINWGDGGATVTADQISRFAPPVPLAGLPALAPALFAEFLLLDPTNAPLLATAAGLTPSAVQLAALAAGMAAPQPVAPAVVPAILPAAPWQQPWHPLFLDWQVEWFPIRFQAWAFNGLDYDLSAALPPGEVGRLITGRTVLTPKPSFEFKTRLDTYLKDYPESPLAASLQEVEDEVGAVDDWDFLSQSLGGMSAAIALRQPIPTANPAALADQDGTAALIGDQAGLPPDPKTSEFTTPPPPSTFEGLRAGQFAINRLAIVDAFGQALDIVLPPGSGDPLPRSPNGAEFAPLIADGLAVSHAVDTAHPHQFVQLPPRLLQPARLNFRFEPADGSAIAGWILPNHLDSALAFYGPDGAGLGELSRGLEAPIWLPVPGSAIPVIPAVAPADASPLVKFLVGLKAAGGDALDAFLQAIDETLWTIDPLGARTDDFLSVLVGRPLALVTATLSLELQGEAWRDPDWPYTFEPRPDPLFLGYDFPVRLGDLGYRQDGLLGYFPGGDYSAFHNIHSPAPGDAPASGYLKPIAPGNYINLRFAAKGEGARTALTMIVDPRASIHAQCALFPVKDISLPPAWVDDALAPLVLGFRTGPLLAGFRELIPPGGGTAVRSIAVTCPAERRGSWTWLEQNGEAWQETPLAPVDLAATFPDTPPTLREGLLRLKQGIGG